MVCLSYGQVIIKDTIDIEVKRAGLADEEPPVESFLYTITVHISTTSPLFHPSPRKITLITLEGEHVITECTQTSNCPIPSDGFPLTVSSNSPSVNIIYTGGANTPTGVRLERISSATNLYYYIVWFTYPPSLGLGERIAGSVRINFTSVPVLTPPTYTYYSQSGGNWWDDVYDGVDGIIEDWGCALTCMAMTLKAYGINADPGTLNTAMQSNNRYKKGGGVDWTYVPEASNGVVAYNEDYSGNGMERESRFIDGKDRNVVDFTKSSSKNLSDIDTKLANGYTVIVCVANPHTALDGSTYYTQHWVLVYKKDLSQPDVNGSSYKIHDPQLNSIGTLAHFSGTIYAYLSYRRK